MNRVLAEHLVRIAVCVRVQAGQTGSMVRTGRRSNGLVCMQPTSLPMGANLGTTGRHVPVVHIPTAQVTGLPPVF